MQFRQESRDRTSGVCLRGILNSDIFAYHGIIEVYFEFYSLCRSPPFMLPGRTGYLCPFLIQRVGILPLASGSGPKRLPPFPPRPFFSLLVLFGTQEVGGNLIAILNRRCLRQLL